MTTIGRYCVLGLAAFLAMPAMAQTADGVARDLAVRSNRVVVELKILKASGGLSAAAALALIQQEMSPIIDYSVLARQATGKYWRRAKDDEKQKITASFRKLLENTYSKVLARYSEQKVRVVESKVRADKTILVTVEVSGISKSVQIIYVFGTQTPRRVTDLKVEGISLLDTYRRQFAQIAKKYGTAGLAARLRELAGG